MFPRMLMIMVFLASLSFVNQGHAFPGRVGPERTISADTGPLD